MSAVDCGTYHDAHTCTDADAGRDRPTTDQNADRKTDAPAEDDAETRT